MKYKIYNRDKMLNKFVDILNEFRIKLFFKCNNSNDVVFKCKILNNNTI